MRFGRYFDDRWHTYVFYYKRVAPCGEFDTLLVHKLKLDRRGGISDTDFMIGRVGEKDDHVLCMAVISGADHQIQLRVDGEDFMKSIIYVFFRNEIANETSRLHCVHVRQVTTRRSQSP